MYPCCWVKEKRHAAMGAADNQVGAGEMTEVRATPGRGSRLSDMSRFLFQKREEALRGSPRDGPTASRCQGLQLGGANRSMASASEIRYSGVVSSIPGAGGGTS